MEWTYPLDGGRGRLTVRREGTRVEVRSRISDDGQGLYKVWLLGPGGELPLGTLLPEGRELRLERRLDGPRLEAQGFWPPSGALVRRTFTFGAQKKHPAQGPRGFARVRPDQVLGDPVLRVSGGTGELWTKRAGEESLLLVPFYPGKPLPLAPAFCLMRVVEREGARWAALRLDERGWPVLPPPTAEELF